MEPGTHTVEYLRCCTKPYWRETQLKRIQHCNSMATSSQEDKEARRRKIRELEASLFNNEWTSEKTDLPQEWIEFFYAKLHL